MESIPWQRHPFAGVTRPRPLGQVLAHQDTPDVKVITGVRRCGKSCILAMVVDALAAQGIPDTNIFHRRFDSFDVPLDYDAESLHKELKTCEKNLDTAFPWYVLLDEIQDIDGWERVVRRLHTRTSTDVYLTGSNANLLSGDLATHLTGRFVEINVYPPSFEEYLDFVKRYGPMLNGDMPKEAMSHDALLADYLAYGSLPGLFMLEKRTLPTIGAEIQDIYRSILFKDVAQRFGIRDLGTLEKIGRFILTTSGSLFSLRNMSNTLSSTGLKAAATTVGSQVDALTRAFLVYPVEQTGICGREVLRAQKKYYPVDLGFVACMQNYSGKNLGARLESAVALELIRRGYRISVGVGTKVATSTGAKTKAKAKEGAEVEVKGEAPASARVKNNPSGEIDFVAERLDERGSTKEYVQVCANMGSKETRRRELAPLEALKDAFPRKVITLNRYAKEVTDEGIEIVHAADWLLGRT